MLIVIKAFSIWIPVSALIFTLFEICLNLYCFISGPAIHWSCGRWGITCHKFAARSLATIFIKEWSSLSQAVLPVLRERRKSRGLDFQFGIEVFYWVDANSCVEGWYFVACSGRLWIYVCVYVVIFCFFIHRRFFFFIWKLLLVLNAVLAIYSLSGILFVSFKGFCNTGVLDSHTVYIFLHIGVFHDFLNLGEMLSEI